MEASGFSWSRVARDCSHISASLSRTPPEWVARSKTRPWLPLLLTDSLQAVSRAPCRSLRCLLLRSVGQRLLRGPSDFSSQLICPPQWKATRNEIFIFSVFLHSLLQTTGFPRALTQCCVLTCFLSRLIRISFHAQVAVRDLAGHVGKVMQISRFF